MLNPLCSRAIGLAWARQSYRTLISSFVVLAVFGGLEPGGEALQDLAILLPFRSYQSPSRLSVLARLA